MKTTTSKYLRLVEREGLASEMNNTKWHRVIRMLERYAGGKRLKYVDDDFPTSWHKAVWLASKSYVDSPKGPQKLRMIEWIEVQTRGTKDFPLAEADADELIRELSRSRIALENQGEAVRIYGYKRPRV